MTITSLYLGCLINSCFLEELQSDALQLKAMEAQNLLLLEHFQHVRQ